MSSIRQIGFSALLSACLSASCASTPEEEAAHTEAQARIDAEISERRGEAVNRICPGDHDNWRALGENMLLLEARGEWYMVEVVGACDPASAFTLITTRTGPASSCLQRGDNILTGRPPSGQRCVITALYEWDDDAETGAPADVTAVED